MKASYLLFANNGHLNATDMAYIDCYLLIVISKLSHYFECMPNRGYETAWPHTAQQPKQQPRNYTQWTVCIFVWVCSMGMYCRCPGMGTGGV